MTARFASLRMDIGISKRDVLFVHLSMDLIGGGASAPGSLILPSKNVPQG
jgi:hypothetical protein